MSGEHHALAELESIEAGPMPEAIGTAVARRRTARRLRRVGVAAVCVAVVGAMVAWRVLPGQVPYTPPHGLVEEPHESSSGVRFASGSILALRLAGVEDGWPAERSGDRPVREGDVTLYGLRQRELLGPTPPAS